MKADIHPNYKIVTVQCACGETFKTGTTKNTDLIKVDICSKCHPFFTGKQKLKRGKNYEILPYAYNIGLIFLNGEFISF